MGIFKDLGDRISGRHAEKMQQQQIDADIAKQNAQRETQEKTDLWHYQNEEKKRNAEERREDKNRESQERIAKANADATVEKARIEAESLKVQQENKRELARLQVEANAKDQEEQTERTRIEEAEETARAQISAERDVAIAKSADEASVKIREQQRLENQFLESEITRRGELTLEYMKEQLKMLDKERERKHLEFEKLIDSTRERQRELQESFDKTGNIELIEQISDCETTLKQYIAKDKRDEKDYNANKLIINEQMNQLFITSDSGDDE